MHHTGPAGCQPPPCVQCVQLSGLLVVACPPEAQAAPSTAGQAVAAHHGLAATVLATAAPASHVTCLLLRRWAPDTSFTPAALLSIASGVASALAYLHGCGVCHGDVYAHNVLVDGDAHATLVDFGELKQAGRRDILCLSMSPGFDGLMPCQHVPPPGIRHMH